jgi:hypothetical protein
MLFSLPAGAGFGYSLILSLSQLGFRIGDGLQAASPTLGITAVFGAWGLYQLQQLGLWSSYGRSRIGVSTSFASIVKAQSLDPDRQSYIHKWKDPLPEEFIFTGRGLMTPIPETTLDRFIKLAWRRQVNALYGSKLNMVYAGEGYKRLTVNQIFSEKYFTRDTRPRFDQEDYYGCLHILMVTKLLRGRRQGRGGTLTYSYEQSVERAKALWMPYPTKKRTWSTFAGFLPIREVAQS